MGIGGPAEKRGDDAVPDVDAVSQPPTGETFNVGNRELIQLTQLRNREQPGDSRYFNSYFQFTGDRSKQQQQPGDKTFDDGSKVKFERIGDKVVPTKITYANGFSTEYVYKDGQLQSIVNKLPDGKAFETWDKEDKDGRVWKNKSTNEVRTECSIGFNEKGCLEATWKDREGKEHKLQTFGDGGSVESVKIADAFRPVRVYNANYTGASYEYDPRSGEMTSWTAFAPDGKGGFTNHVRYERTRQGVFERKLGPDPLPKTLNAKLDALPSVNASGDFTFTQADGTRVTWKRNSPSPTVER
ncbi:MAG TPA: hypothetical protein V6D17_11425 [Candidatus Obscuribacterales bacterium]